MCIVCCTLKECLGEASPLQCVLPLEGKTGSLIHLKYFSIWTCALLQLVMLLMAAHHYGSYSAVLLL